MSDGADVSSEVVAIGAQCKQCASTKSELRRRPTSNGGVQFKWQCLHCGRATTDAIPHATAAAYGSISEWDFETEKNYTDWLQKRVLDKRVQETAFGLRFSFEEHNRYLLTPAWRQRRTLVLQRSRGKCEGCGVKDAEQVHHLSYAHWKEEFLWELVAVCLECHERFHQRELKKFERG